MCPRTRSAPLPTVLRSGPYRFFFYMANRNEPPHVHVERDALEAKLWLAPVSIAHRGGFSALELGRIERIVREQRVMRWRLIGEGSGIHWPDVDEDISTIGLLEGWPSAEYGRTVIG